MERIEIVSNEIYRCATRSITGLAYWHSFNGKMKVWEVIILGIIWSIALFNQNKNIGSQRFLLIGLRHETIVKWSDACAIVCSSIIAYKSYYRQNSELIHHPEAVKRQVCLSNDSTFPKYYSLWHLADQNLPKSCLWHLAFNLRTGCS